MKILYRIEKFLLSILIIMATANLFGQTDTCFMSNDTLTTNNAIFYDSGGPNGNYSDNENIIKVFTPITVGAKLKINFNSFFTEPDFDVLHIYDGPDTSSPEFTGSPFSGTIVPGQIKASETNSSGAITFHFISDEAANEAGWSAQVISSDADTLVVLTTTYLNSKYSNSANILGNVISDGGKPILFMGFCWNTTGNPTLADNQNTLTNTTGEYFGTITGLDPLTTYFVRSYVSNSSGTFYGNEVSFTSPWSGYHEEDCSSLISYFHPTAGGSYPDSPYLKSTYTKTLKYLEDGRIETTFAIWGTTPCYITINPDNTIFYEAPGFTSTVIMGDPNDASKISHKDPETGKIYLYYYYNGVSGNRIFWEEITLPPPPSAPNGMVLSNKYIPFKYPADLIVSTISAKDVDLNEVFIFELVNGYGDNNLFDIHIPNEIYLKSALNLSSPKDFNIKIKITDKFGLSAEFTETIHSNTDKYEILRLNSAPDNSAVVNISVVNKNVIWAQSYSGFLNRSVDGGITWNNTGPLNAINNGAGPVFSIDSLIAWRLISVGDVGVYKTIDGGNSWLKQSTAYNPSSFPDLIYFWNNNEGFTMGDKDEQGYLETYTTVNGGDTWERVPLSNLSPLMEYTTNTFAAMSVYKDTIWVSGNPGYIFRSVDKGFTWEVFNSPVKNTGGSLIFTDSKNGIFAPWGLNKSLYTSNDGGVTWNPLITNITNLSSNQRFAQIPGTNIISMYNYNSLYFSSDAGKIWKKADYDFPLMQVISPYNDEILWAGGWGYNQIYKINLTDILPCQSDFNSTVNNTTGQVNFFSTSKKATNYYWEFGDGSFDSNSSPVHTYLKGGAYNVKLTIKDSNTGCQASKTKNIKYVPSGVSIIQSDFSYVIDSLTVSFSDLSTPNTTDWYWTMGDGKVLKTQNPVHTYAKPGVYQVCLTAFDKVNILAENVCKEIIVGAQICNIGSDFSYFIDPLARQLTFNSLAKGDVDSYFWTFGDGYSSTDANPSHYYAVPGYYTVTFSVRNSLNNCLDISKKLIQVGSVDCHAGFTYNVDANSYQVDFNDISKGTNDYYYWDFGDGSYSVANNPGHLYKNPGMYKVSQTVIDLVNGCMDNLVQTVQVGSVECAADFMTYTDAVSSTVYFTNKVMGESTALYWSFGDGKFSTLPNPIHSFSTAGFYSAGLNTYDFNTGCMDYYQEILMIGEMGIDCNADFIYSVNTNNNVAFQNTSLGDIVEWQWDFGDGSEIESGTNPEHSYSKAGYYNVCLNVKNSNGIKNMGCKLIGVNVGPENNCRADFMFTLDSATLKVKFVERSFGDIDTYTWNFGDGKSDSISFEKNPTHTYSQKGYYLVQLKVENANSGCQSSEYKLLNVAENQVLKASFGYEAKDPSKKVAGYPVDLVGASSGDGATVEWDFGDREVKKAGFTVMDSTNRIVRHYYQKPGRYQVCFRVTDPVTGQFDISCKYVFTKYGLSVLPEVIPEATIDIYPNPFTNYTNFVYALPDLQHVEIAIFDQLGRRIETLVNTTKEEGIYQIIWVPESLKPGVYLLKFKTRDCLITRQLVISK